MLQGFNVGIAACRENLQWIAALQLFRGMPKAGVTADLVTFNALVNLCGEGPPLILG